MDDDWNGSKGWDSDSEQGHRYGDYDGLGAARALLFVAKWGFIVAVVLILAKLANVI